jgi:hypothetical protein
MLQPPYHGDSDMARSHLLIAVPWFERESYERTRHLPGCDLRGDFDDWLIRARRLLEVMRTTGLLVVRVTLEPDELSDFAKSTGAPAITASVRSELATAKLARSEEIPVPEVPLGCPICREEYNVPGGIVTAGLAVEIACKCGMFLRQVPAADMRAT